MATSAPIELPLLNGQTVKLLHKWSAINRMKDIEINKPRTWNGNKLAGEWLVTLKVDGVRAIWHDEQGWLSRANKPLYNIPPWRQGAPATARFSSEPSATPSERPGPN